jgi:hypothetical protein
VTYRVVGRDGEPPSLEGLNAFQANQIRRLLQGTGRNVVVEPVARGSR